MSSKVIFDNQPPAALLAGRELSPDIATGTAIPVYIEQATAAQREPESVTHTLQTTVLFGSFLVALSVGSPVVVAASVIKNFASRSRYRLMKHEVRI